MLTLLDVTILKQECYYNHRFETVLKLNDIMAIHYILKDLELDMSPKIINNKKDHKGKGKEKKEKEDNKLPRQKKEFGVVLLDELNRNITVDKTLHSWGELRKLLNYISIFFVVLNGDPVLLTLIHL